MASESKMTIATSRPVMGDLEGLPAEHEAQAAEALKAAGAGAAIGSLIGAMAGGSGRSAIAGGMAGGAIGLIVKGIAQEPGAASDLAIAVRRNWEMTRDAFSRLVGYAPRTIAGYEAGVALGPVPRRRYTEAQRLRSALEEVMKPEYVTRWLGSPNPAFDGSTPIQVIERGEIDRVWATVYHIDSGMS